MIIGLIPRPVPFPSCCYGETSLGLVTLSPVCTWRPLLSAHTVTHTGVIVYSEEEETFADSRVVASSCLTSLNHRSRCRIIMYFVLRGLQSRCSSNTCSSVHHVVTAVLFHCEQAGRPKIVFENYCFNLYQTTYGQTLCKFTLKCGGSW